MRQGDGGRRARGRTGGGRRDGPRGRGRERKCDRTVPRHSIVPLHRKAAPLHRPSSPDGAVSNPFYRFNEYNFLASPPLDPPLPAVGPRRSSRSPPPLIAAATITTANLLSSGTNAESRLPGATVPPPISRVMEMIIEFGWSRQNFKFKTQIPTPDRIRLG